MQPLLTTWQPPQAVKDAAAFFADRHRLEAGRPQRAESCTARRPFGGNAKSLGPLLPARSVGAAMPFRVGGGEVLAGMGQFMEQGHLEQS